MSKLLVVGRACLAIVDFTLQGLTSTNLMCELTSIVGDECVPERDLK